MRVIFIIVPIVVVVYDGNGESTMAFVRTNMSGGLEERHERDVALKKRIREGEHNRNEMFGYRFINRFFFELMYRTFLAT